MELPGIGGAASAAVEPREALPALLLGVHVAELELVPDIRPGDALVHIAQQEALIPHKLVAGIEVSPGGHRQVLGAGAAA